MPHINKRVSNYDKTIIYVQTARKIYRGAIRSAFLSVKSYQCLSENMLI